MTRELFENRAPTTGTKSKTAQSSMDTKLGMHELNHPFVGLHSESHHVRQQCSQLKPKKMRCAVPKRDLGISWFCGCDHGKNTLCTL